MIVENLDITRFGNLHALQEFIDQHDEELIENFEITDVYIKYKSGTATAVEIPLVHAKLHCFLADIRADGIHFMMASPGRDGLSGNVYPDMSTFDREAYDYIAIRTKQSRSKIISTRYFPLLWKAISTRKDKSNALGGKKDTIYYKPTYTHSPYVSYQN